MTDVFVSYSRKDVAFAHVLVDSLKARNLEPWIDWEDIPPSADWLDEIYRAIEAADTFVYIVSHASKNSEVCSKEVQHAIENHKRLVPIVIQPEIRPSELPPALAAINWIFFPGRENVSPEEMDFQQSFDKLLAAIQTDLAWVKAHTRMQVRALEWENKHHDASFLLRGRDLRDGESGLAQVTEKTEPQPTALQKQYVLASRRDADKRQRITLGAVLAGLGIAIVLALVALAQSNLAQANAVAESQARATAVTESFTRATAEGNALNQRATAEAASTVAVQQRDEAQRQSKLALAGKLAAQSQLLFKNQLDLGLLLSAEASRTANTAEALLSPRLALEYSPRLLRLNQSASGARAFALSPDGRTLALAECLAKNAETNIGKICSQGRLSFLDLPSGKFSSKTLDLGSFSAGYLGFNPVDQGRTLILVGYKSVALVDLQSGDLVGEFPTGQKETRYYPTAVAFSPDGRWLAIGSCGDRSKGGDSNGYCNLGEVRIWDIQNRRLAGQPLAAHDSNVDAMAFSPDSRLLATAGGANKNQSIRLWDIPADLGDQEILQNGEVFKSTETVTNALAFSPDGKLLASGGSDYAITVWTVASRLPVGNPLMGHTYFIDTLAFSPDGKTLASGSWDDTLLLWDVASRQPLSKPMTGHKADVASVTFSPDGQRLVSMDANGDLAAWDTGSQFAGSPIGQVLPQTKGTFLWTNAFSPDGSLLAYSSGSNIYLWDMLNSQPLTISPLIGHTAEVHSLVFPPQDVGKTLVSASIDHATITWDVASGKPIRQTGQDLDSNITAAFITPDGSRLLYRSNQGTFTLNLADGKTRSKLSLGTKDNPINAGQPTPDLSKAAALSCETHAADNTCTSWSVLAWDIPANQLIGQPARGLTRFPQGFALSPDGKTLAYNYEQNGRIVLWDVQAGKVRQEIMTPRPNANSYSYAYTLVFSPDGSLLAASYLTDFRVILWDTASGKMVGQPFSDQYNIDRPAFSPDGKIIAWPLKNEPFLWDIAAQAPLGQPLIKGDAGGILVFSPDGSQVAIGGGSLTSVEKGAQVFDVRTGKPLGKPMIGHVSNVISLGFMANQQLYTFSKEGTLDVWDLASGKLVGQPLAGYLGNYAKIDLSPDGKTLALAACSQKPGNDCTQIELWLQDTTSGQMDKQAFSLKSSVSMLRYSHNGKLLAIVSGKQVIVWDVAGQKTLFIFEDSAQAPDALAFNPQDTLLAVKSSAVSLWDLTTGKTVGDPLLDRTTSQQGQPLAISEDFGIAFSPLDGGKLLATVGGVSGSLMLVDSASGQPYGPLLIDQRSKLMTGMMLSVSFSPDGKWLVSGNNSGTAFLWSLDPVVWQKKACQVAGRSLTQAEWTLYMPASEPYQPDCP